MKGHIPLLRLFKYRWGIIMEDIKYPIWPVGPTRCITSLPLNCCPHHESQFAAFPLVHEGSVLPSLPYTGPGVSLAVKTNLA